MVRHNVWYNGFSESSEQLLKSLMWLHLHTDPLLRPFYPYLPLCSRWLVVVQRLSTVYPNARATCNTRTDLILFTLAAVAVPPHHPLNHRTTHWATPRTAPTVDCLEVLVQLIESECGPKQIKAATSLLPLLRHVLGFSLWSAKLFATVFA